MWPIHHPLVMGYTFTRHPLLFSHPDRPDGVRLVTRSRPGASEMRSSSRCTASSRPRSQSSTRRSALAPRWSGRSSGRELAELAEASTGVHGNLSRKVTKVTGQRCWCTWSLSSYLGKWVRSYLFLRGHVPFSKVLWRVQVLLIESTDRNETQVQLDTYCGSETMRRTHHLRNGDGRGPPRSMDVGRVLNPTDRWCENGT